jgi:hypothetical protein
MQLQRGYALAMLEGCSGSAPDFKPLLLDPLELEFELNFKRSHAADMVDNGPLPVEVVA